MDRSTSRVPVGRLVMKKFDVLPEKEHLLYVGINKVGSSSSTQIHISHRLVQKNHLEFDCNDAGVAAVRDVVQLPQDASITIVPTKVRQPSDDGKSMTEHDLRLNTWSELKSGARVKIGNLISLIYEPFDVKDLPVASLSRARSSSRGVQTSVDLGQQTSRSYGDRDVTRSYDHSRYSQKSRSTGPSENLAQETTASSSRVPGSQGEDEQRPVYEQHILRELGLEPGIHGEQEPQEYEHNVPDDELCTLSLCEMTESYLSYFNSYGEDDMDYDRSSRKGKGRATDSATDIETTPPRARVQVPFRMLPPELTQPSAYFLAQSIPEEELMASNAGGPNQEAKEEPNPNEEHEEAGEHDVANEAAGEEEGTNEEAGDKENINEEAEEEERTKESDKPLQIPKQSTKEDPSQASTSTSASASGPTLLSSQESSPRTSPKKASPKFVADGPDSENIEPSASRSQSVSPDKRSSKSMGPPVEDAPRQLRARTRASIVKLTKIDGNKDDATNSPNRRSDSSGVPTPLADPEATSVASEPLTPTQKRSRSRSTYQHDMSRPGGKIGRRRK
ncbi:hypothetical protein BGZ82_005502 [Podila clonocystis]|nr:hypothetical protein BGZ82_005502 [Podila clonocystis]